MAHWRWDDLLVRLLYCHHDYAISSFLYLPFLVLQYGLELMSWLYVYKPLYSPLLSSGGPSSCGCNESLLRLYVQDVNPKLIPGPVGPPGQAGPEGPSGLPVGRPNARYLLVCIT